MNFKLTSRWMLGLAVVGLVSGCTDDVQRSGQGDQATAARTQGVSDMSASTTSDSTMSGRMGDGMSGETSAVDSSSSGATSGATSMSGAAAAGANITQPAVDINSFNFERKGELKNQMTARLQGLGKAIEGLKASTGLKANEKSEQATQSAANQADQVQKLQAQHSQVMAKMNTIDQVQSQGWESFKKTLGTDVANLERGYQDLAKTVRQ